LTGKNGAFFPPLLPMLGLGLNPKEQEKSESALSTDKLDKSILNSAQSTASSGDNFIGDIQNPTSATGVNSPNENHQKNLPV
jgi:hypothetical protein